MTSASTFPAEWVDAVFARLSLAYGVRFTQQWEGLNPEHVKASWRRELDGITSRGIAYALQHLPRDYPPNAMQFRALCVGAPTAQQALKALDGPPVSKANVQRVADAVAVLRAPKDPKAWAYRLKAREEAGERLSRVQREMWRAALHSSSTWNSEASIGAGSSAVQGDNTVNGTAYAAS